MQREIRQFLKTTRVKPASIGTDYAPDISVRKTPYPLWQVPMLFGLESIAVLVLVRVVTIDPGRLNDRATLSIAVFASLLAAACIKTVILWRRQPDMRYGGGHTRRQKNSA